MKIQVCKLPKMHFEESNHQCFIVTWISWVQKENKTRSAANYGNSTTVFDAVNSDPKGGQKAALFPKLR